MAETLLAQISNGLDVVFSITSISFSHILTLFGLLFILLCFFSPFEASHGRDGGPDHVHVC